MALFIQKKSTSKKAAKYLLSSGISTSTNLYCYVGISSLSGWILSEKRVGMFNNETDCTDRNWIREANNFKLSKMKEERCIHYTYYHSIRNIVQLLLYVR